MKVNSFCESVITFARTIKFKGVSICGGICGSGPKDISNELFLQTLAECFETQFFNPEVAIIKQDEISS